MRRVDAERCCAERDVLQHLDQDATEAEHDDRGRTLASRCTPMKHSTPPLTIGAIRMPSIGCVRRMLRRVGHDLVEGGATAVLGARARA